jgi:hypothetical protein
MVRALLANIAQLALQHQHHAQEARIRTRSVRSVLTTASRAHLAISATPLA